MRVTRVFTVLAAVALVGVACGDDSGTGIPSGVEIFTATLNGANEVPALPTPTTATGTATMTVLGNLLSWKVDAQDIENVSVGHIHLAVAGEPGGVIQDLTPTPGDYPTLTTIALGSLEVGDDILSAMRAGSTYVNIHTSDAANPDNNVPGDYPGGEIRGQLRKH
ncbi:MAG: CHRD domain-containing protein [Gemmatimonadales bacterium]|nr:CHRD domain-containing protein [Gemmatimonadales bacterium]